MPEEEKKGTLNPKWKNAKSEECFEMKRCGSCYKAKMLYCKHKHTKDGELLTLEEAG